jgi:hypothetical protein
MLEFFDSSTGRMVILAVMTVAAMGMAGIVLFT